MKSLRVRGLRKTFVLSRDWLSRPRRTAEAVRGVDLDIAAGETLALVGESGSGKSTVARLMLQLIQPDAGTIQLDGQSLLGLEGSALRRMRRRMQIIFQDPYGSLDPTLSIRDVIGEPMRIHRDMRADSAELEKLIASVGLPSDFLDRMPHELSGGQRQRVAIARALAVAPEFIACDEIVSALDVSTRAQILKLMRTLQQERGVAMLFITHDLSIVPYIAQRVAVIHLGEIVEEGRVDDVFARPAHPYTQALLSAVPLPDPRRAKRHRTGDTE